MPQYLNIIIATLLILVGGYEFQQAQQYKTRAESAEASISPMEADLAKEREFNRKLREELADAKTVADNAQQELANAKLQSDKDADELADLRSLSEKQHNQILLFNQKLGNLSPRNGSGSDIGISAPLATGYDPLKARAQNFLSFFKSVATVSGKSAQGDGFLAKFKDGTVLITNSHLICNNDDLNVTLANGKTVDLQNMSLADGYDVVELHDVTLPDGLEVASNLADSVMIGDEVAVLSNATGDGASSVVYGRIKTIGPAVLDLSCNFSASSSGSPVIQVKSGQVIGVATYELGLPDLGLNANPSHWSKVERHLAYRLDNVPNWLPLNQATFNSLGQTCDAVVARTDDLLGLAKEFTPGQELNYSHYYDDKNSLSESVKQLQTASTSDKQAGLSQTKSHVLEAQASFLSDVIDTCSTDLTSINLDQFDGYHRQLLVQQQKIRDALCNYFKNQLNAVNAQASN